MRRQSDNGSTLVEVLISTAVASVALAGAAGLLVSSARAVAESELETTAVWVASRTIEAWRASADAPLEGRERADRSGDDTTGAGMFGVTWRASAASGGVHLWRVTVIVTHERLRQDVITEVMVSKVPS